MEILKEKKPPQVWDIGTIFVLNRHTSTTTQKSYPQFHYFHFFITAGCYSFTIPYNIQYNPLSGRRDLVSTGKLHKVIVLIVWGLTLFRGSTWLRNALETAVEKRFDMSSYFIVTAGISFLFVTVFYFWKLLSSFEDLQKLVENIGSCSLLKCSGVPRILGWICIVCFHFGYTIISLCMEFSRGGWDILEVYKSLLNSGRFSFFKAKSDEYHVNTANILLAAVTFLVRFASNIQMPFVLTIFIIAPLTIFVATSNLLSLVKNEKNVTMKTSQLRIKFEELNVLSQSVNAMWGSHLLCQLVNTSLYFCTSFHDTMLKNDYLPQLRNTVYFLQVGIGSVLSAKCSNMKERFVSDLTQRLQFVSLRSHQQKHENEELNLLIEEGEESLICIGVEHIYKLDFRLIYEGIVVILTFLFISVQCYSVGRKLFE